MYSAALEKGYSPATIVNDSPLVVPASYPGGPEWIPHNYENVSSARFRCAKRLRSRAMSPPSACFWPLACAYARDFVSRFGLPLEQIPSYPSMVLGTGSFTPLQMAAAYAVFANGGYRVTPHFVDSVANVGGGTLYQASRSTPGRIGRRLSTRATRS